MDDRRVRSRRNWVVFGLVVMALAVILFITDPAIFGVPIMWIFGS